MHYWTANDYLVVNPPTLDGQLTLVDLQRGTTKALAVHGTILATTGTHILVYQQQDSSYHRLSVYSCPQFSTVASVAVEYGGVAPTAAIVYDLHVFVLVDGMVHVYDQQLRKVAACSVPINGKDDHHNCVHDGAFFVGTVGSKSRLGLVCRIGESLLCSYLVEYQWGPQMALTATASIELKVGSRQVLLAAVQSARCFVVAVVGKNMVVKMDPFGLKVEKTCDLGDSDDVDGALSDLRVDKHLLLLLYFDGAVKVFDLFQMAPFKLTRTDVTIMSNDNDNNNHVANMSFACSPNGDYIATFNHDADNLSVYSIDAGNVDTMMFCKRLLSSSASPLSVTDAWTFRLRLANDKDQKATLTSFTSSLITQASEAGKGSNLGTICRVLLFLCKFVPALSGGHVPFLWLNDLDRTVTMLTTMTGKAERVVQAIDDIITKGAAVNLDDFVIGESLDVLLTLVPLLKVQLERMLFLVGGGGHSNDTLYRHILALSSWRRRAVSVVAFAMAIHRQISDYQSMLDPAVVSELRSIFEQRQHYGLPLHHLNDAFISDLRTVGFQLAQLRATKRINEHDQSVNVLCMLMTNDSSLFPDLAPLLASIFGGNDDNDKKDKRYYRSDGRIMKCDTVRGCHLLSGVPSMGCRVCAGRVMRLGDKGPRLFVARWNDLYQSRCVCGGEYA